ncbi:uncharacterized protein [Triticum aestivum]|uniref:uncharacterized protein n=1 Tax=Triticum aestivum TaxID=4565 RepID=UPI001D026666|nr:uncharacterized protein LOC123059058 [Triticum aestivum]
MAVNAPAPATARLPRAAVSFEPCHENSRESGKMAMMSLKNDVVVVNGRGGTVLYDGASGALRTMQPAPLHSPARSNFLVSVTVGDGLYVMSLGDGGYQTPYFQALVYGRQPGDRRAEDWHWRPLPSPTFDHCPDHDDCPSSRYDECYHDVYAPTGHQVAIGAYTVVGGSRIWVSATTGAGTYSFDTASGAWSKAGEWALPFKGRAEYVPEHGLWFGLSDKDGHLCVCAADLATTTVPPALLHAWEDPPAPPEAWRTTAARLLPLGSGRLCIARFFETSEECNFAVLAGVEVVRDGDAGTRNLRVIRHKSKRYNFGYDGVKPL